MKNLIYICIAIFLFACTEPESEIAILKELTPKEKEVQKIKQEVHRQIKEEKSVRIHNLNHSDFRIITIDSCEYIQFHNKGYEQAAGGLTHKANCKNSFHKTDK